jgi:two-component system KDP operon response regulator KdpE
MRILLVEDDAALSLALSSALSGAGYAVDAAGTAEDALHMATHEPYDAIALDIGLPDRSGLEVLAATRAAGVKAPVILLTARDGVDDRVRGLDTGADDYLVKPFGTEELVARIRAVLRRQADVTAGEPVIRSGDLEIDIGRRTVTVQGKVVRLTPTEYELLRYLALHAGKPVTHTTLLRQVWGDYAIGDKYNTRYVVAQIRKKLGDDPANPRYIVNEPGVGYRLEG